MKQRNTTCGWRHFPRRLCVLCHTCLVALHAQKRFRKSSSAARRKPGRRRTPHQAITILLGHHRQENMDDFRDKKRNSVAGAVNLICSRVVVDHQWVSEFSLLMHEQDVLKRKNSRAVHRTLGPLVVFCFYEGPALVTERRVLDSYGTV